MNTDIELHQSNGLAPATTHTLLPVESIGQIVEQFGHLAGQIARTDFVPADFKGRPDTILAAMLYGRELGLGPMQSLNLVQSIKGRVGLKPEGMRALVRQKGHRIWPAEITDTTVTLCGWRQGDPTDAVVTVTWSMDDAKRAGLGSGDNWRKYPRAMLTARATSELCRLHFADVIGGLSYTPEELGDFDEPPVFPPAAPSALPAPPVAAGPLPGETIPASTQQATARRRPPTRRTESGEEVLQPVAWKSRMLAEVRKHVESDAVAKAECEAFFEAYHPEFAVKGERIELAESKVTELIGEVLEVIASHQPQPAPEPEVEQPRLAGGGDDDAPF